MTALSLVATAVACEGGGGPTNPANGPTLTEISPGSGAVGDRANTVNVSLTGSGFDAGNVQVNVSGPVSSPVEVANIEVSSPTYLTADFIIPGGTSTGERKVTVSTDAGTSGSVPFEIGFAEETYDPDVVEIHDNYPSPTYLTIEVGKTVQFKNVGHNDHTVQTYGNPGMWDAALLEPDQQFHLTFYEEGVFGYICGIHQAIGFITVVDAGSVSGSSY